MAKENIIPEKLKQLDESKDRVGELDEKWQEESAQFNENIKELILLLPPHLRGKINQEIKEHAKNEQNYDVNEYSVEDIKVLPIHIVRKIVEQVEEHNKRSETKNVIDIEDIKNHIAAKLADQDDKKAV